MRDFSKLVNECEALIRSGQDHKVSRELAKLNTAKVARKWRLPIANIARRTSQITIGLRLLTPVVRSENNENKPTPEELCEYAILLQRAGSVNEALSILENLSF